MIIEDYVSFEVAKLLKEKGFHEECKCQYGRHGSIGWTSCNNGNVITFARPTLQMAMKWLREVHKKWITITFHWHTVDGETTLYYSPYIMLSEYENVVLEDKNPFKMKLFNSYEEACEAAIKYCLEHLI